MQKRYIRWILAIIITLSAAVYQRLTGPTYPMRGTAEIGSTEIPFRLLRSHGGEGDLPVTLTVPDSSFHAELYYRRYKTDKEWHLVKMEYANGTLNAVMPHQPPAGKLEYFIKLKHAQSETAIPKGTTVVARFKGGVPAGVLIPHILFMFIAMLMSSVTALEALVSGEKIRIYTIITFASLFIGGMILGPVVQKYAFGAYWTGVPFGYDLTDNKTLFAIVGWGLAFWRVWKPNQAVKYRWWVVAAALILLAVYSIPHSAMGSELDYSKMEVVTG